MWKICLVVLVASVAVQDIAADCNICNSNGATCINKTAFHLCDANVAKVGQTFVCPLATQVCTKLGPICAVPAANVKADCGDDTQCGQCANARDGSYTCTSRSSFTMCFSNALSTVKGTCAQGQVCLISRGAQGTMPCANECLRDPADMCNTNWPVDVATTVSPPTTVIIQPTPTTPSTPTNGSTPTTASPPTNGTTITPGSTNPNTICQGQNMVGRFPLPGDATCTRYVNCYTSGGVLVGRLMTCPTGRFFNRAVNNCQITRPANC